MATDLDQKKMFLLQGSELYTAMIELTNNQVLRRYLAFRIIVNAMAFEELIDDRRDQRMRDIRNVLLAHKQEARFFEAFEAYQEITRLTVAPLLDFMRTKTGTPDPNYLVPELQPGSVKQKLERLVEKVFKMYDEEFLAGNRLTNNFLCYTGNSIHEVSQGDLAGVFYRYNSSKALFILADRILAEAEKDPDLLWLTRHAKLDLLLHAQNMTDCIIKDRLNGHSIDGLLEFMTAGGVGDPAALVALSQDQAFRTKYQQVRFLRNKLIGHMDGKLPLQQTP